MNKKTLASIIDNFCPNSLAEPWDNCGWQLQCGSLFDEVQKLLVSLEVTDAVIAEALEVEADIIVTHHPLLFSPVKKIDEEDVVGRYLVRLIEAGISVYSCHTNFDKLDGGNNDYMGLLLELENLRPFDKDNGFCRKGNTTFNTTFMEIIHKTSEALQTDEKYFRWVGDLSKPVETIGWCTGAGSEFLKAAKEEGCDLFITGDLKYHEAQLAREMGLCVLDAGHYGSERIFTDNMADMIRDHTFGQDIEIFQSDQDLNPFA